jgi:hypothetical protein
MAGPLALLAIAVFIALGVVFMAVRARAGSSQRVDARPALIVNEGAPTPPGHLQLVLIARQPRWVPRPIWVALVSPSCGVKIDDRVAKLRWGREVVVSVERGRHDITVFHQLGTLSARTLVAEIETETNTVVEYRSRFWPFRPGRLVIAP